MTPGSPPHDRSNAGLSVQLHVVGEIARKPPLTELQVDVVILNHSSEPRWVLLPRQAGHRPGADGGVDVLELEQRDGVTIGSWLGTGGFRAVHAPADADIRIGKLPVQWWRHDDDPQPDIEVVAVKTLRIDGKPAELWLAEAASAGTLRHRPDSAEVTVELVAEVRVDMIPWPRD